MAAIIAFAQAKGGAGKTTAAVGLSLELAERGYRVCLIDCDANHHAAQFGLISQAPGLIVLPPLSPQLAPNDHGQPQITEKTLYAEITRAEGTGTEVILIDLPGVLSRVGLTAMLRSHLVIIPIQASMLDARDAVSTLADVDLARQSTDRRIEARALMSCMKASVETTWGRKVKGELKRHGLPVLEVEMIEREVFKDCLAAGVHPLRIDLGLYRAKNQRAKKEAIAKAAENLAALADEVLALLEQMLTERTAATVKA